MKSVGTASDRGPLRAALVCAAVALLLRLFYLTEAAGNPFWRHLGLDMTGYDEWAQAILHGHGLGEAPFTQAPLFPLLLSAAYAVVGTDPVRALWIHLLPGTLAVFLVAHAAGIWKGSAAAWGAGQGVPVAHLARLPAGQRQVRFCQRLGKQRVKGFVRKHASP